MEMVWDVPIANWFCAGDCFTQLTSARPKPPHTRGSEPMSHAGVTAGTSVLSISIPCSVSLSPFMRQNYRFDTVKLIQRLPGKHCTAEGQVSFCPCMQLH